MVAHKLRGNDAVPTRKNLLALVLEGEVDEFLVYFQEWKTLINDVQVEVAQVEADLISAWALNRYLGSQKEFALAVKDVKASWALFKARQQNLGQGDPLHVFHAAPLSQKMKVFGV
jgi:hypothetical protein